VTEWVGWFNERESHAEHEGNCEAGGCLHESLTTCCVGRPQPGLPETGKRRLYVGLCFPPFLRAYDPIFSPTLFAWVKRYR
jgi:hypothetical protein